LPGPGIGLEDWGKEVRRLGGKEARWLGGKEAWRPWDFDSARLSFCVAYFVAAPVQCCMKK